MIRLLPTVVTLFALVSVAPAASATPAAPVAAPAVAIPAALVYRPHPHAGPHHRFNRFDQHRGFHRYRERHCTTMQTPNGPVKRCRV